MTIINKPPVQQTPSEPNVGRRLAMPQIVGGVVLVFIGALWLLERTGALDISVTAVLALATMVVGISLMLLANRGAHGGLIVFGTILALVTTVTAAAPFEGFQGGLGDRTIEVTSVDAIQPDYNLAMGTLTIDLRGLDDLQTPTSLTASVGMGELIIRIPEGTNLDIQATAGAGEVEILGRNVDGVGIDETYRSPGYVQGSASLVMQLEVLTGRVEVTDE